MKKPKKKEICHWGWKSKRYNKNEKGKSLGAEIKDKTNDSLKM